MSGFRDDDIYERPKIYEIDQIAKFKMWLSLEILEQGTFPDSTEVYEVMKMFFSHLLTWDRELQAPLREQIAKEIMAKCENAEHGNGCIDAGDDWFRTVCTHLEDAKIARGLK